MCQQGCNATKQLLKVFLEDEQTHEVGDPWRTSARMCGYGFGAGKFMSRCDNRSRSVAVSA